MTVNVGSYDKQESIMIVEGAGDVARIDLPKPVIARLRPKHMFGNGCRDLHILHIGTDY